MTKGLTHIYTGDGKGKTTAAMGLALRALGAGLKVRIFQFCKNQPTGELTKIGKIAPGIVRRADCPVKKFVWDMTEAEKSDWSEAQQALFDEACDAACDKDVDVVVMDALIGVYAHERIKPQRVRLNLDLEVAAPGVTGEDMAAVVKGLVSQGHVTLIETLAERIAARCLEDERISTVKVRVEKLDVFPDAASVGVEIERARA